MKNYYLLMQIAHMIAQLVEKLLVAQQGLKQANRTIRAWVADVLAIMKKETLTLRLIHQYYLENKQPSLLAVTNG